MLGDIERARTEHKNIGRRSHIGKDGVLDKSKDAMLFCLQGGVCPTNPKFQAKSIQSMNR